MNTFKIVGIGLYQQTMMRKHFEMRVWIQIPKARNFRARVAALHRHNRYGRQRWITHIDAAEHIAHLFRRLGRGRHDDGVRLIINANRHLREKRMQDMGGVRRRNDADGKHRHDWA